MRRSLLLAAAVLLAGAPAQARSPQASRHGAARYHVVRVAAHRLARPASDADGWGTTVYGASLPSVNGTCVDPFDPDPVGGPDHVGDGGPGGFGPQCRTQAGVVPGTWVR